MRFPCGTHLRLWPSAKSQGGYDWVHGIAVDHASSVDGSMSREEAMRIQERISGGLIGLLVGDAHGVPFEFHSPEALPPANWIEY